MHWQLNTNKLLSCDPLVCPEPWDLFAPFHVMRSTQWLSPALTVCAPTANARTSEQPSAKHQSNQQASTSSNCRARIQVWLKTASLSSASKTSLHACMWSSLAAAVANPIIKYEYAGKWTILPSPDTTIGFEFTSFWYCYIFLVDWPQRIEDHKQSKTFQILDGLVSPTALLRCWMTPLWLPGGACWTLPGSSRRVVWFIDAYVDGYIVGCILQ